MRELTDNDTITENYVYARFNINDIPPAVLKQIAEAAYIEGWQDGAARSSEIQDEQADLVRRWEAILDLEHPAHTPMSMRPTQRFHVVYNWRGNCVAYYYEDTEEDSDD